MVKRSNQPIIILRDDVIPHYYDVILCYETSQLQAQEIMSSQNAVH